MGRGKLTLGMAVMVTLWSLAAVPAALAQANGAISSAPPPNGAVGNTYLHQFTTTGLSPAPTFAVTSGVVPPGVIIDAQGNMFGVPTTAGTFGPTTVCASNGVQPPACQTFTVVIRKLTPLLFSQPSDGGPVGTPVHNTTTVGSQQTPTGTITFRLYSDAGCTNEVFSNTKAVDAQGKAVSDDFVPTAPGTYRWSVFYSGDANHDPSEFACSPVNTVTITGTPTTTTSTTTIPPTTTSTSTVPPTTTSTSTTVPPTTTTTSTSSTSTTSTSTTVPPTTTSSSSSTTSTSTTSTSTTSTTSTSTTSTSTTSTTVPPTSTSSSTSSTSTSSTSTSSTLAPTSTSTSSTLAPTSTTSSSVPTTTTTTSSTTTTSTTGPPSPSTGTTMAPTSTTSSTLATTTATTAPGPSISTDTTQAAPGQNVTVTGSGFPPGARLAAELFSDPVQLGTTVADASGRFRMVVTVPLGTSPGLHTLRVRVIDGTLFADTTLLVVPAAALRAAQAATLSRTGADSARRAGLAFVLVAAGLVLVGLAWNDRRPVGFAGRRSAWPARRRRF